jgi:hypothetical protein
VRMEFFDEDRSAPKLTSVQHQYTKEEFERAAVQGGMSPPVEGFVRNRSGSG